MTNFEELLQESGDYRRYVPPLIQSSILDNFGLNISRRELFTKPVIDRLFQGTVELLKRNPDTSGFEALSFLMCLQEVEWAISDVWPEELGEPYSTKPELGTAIYDCLEMSDNFLALLRDIYSRGTLFSLQNARRVNFCSSPGTCSEFGESQNMACFELATGEERRHFLVDVAAFYYHDVWAKAFEGEGYDELINRGINWLNEVPNSNWFA